MKSVAVSEGLPNGGIIDFGKNVIAICQNILIDFC